jgi:hypothetical protein
VVTSCNELELFDFSGCDLVSDATVQAALDSVKLRTNNIKLTLVVGGEFDYSVSGDFKTLGAADLVAMHQFVSKCLSSGKRDVKSLGTVGLQPRITVLPSYKIQFFSKFII